MNPDFFFLLVMVFLPGFKVSQGDVYHLNCTLRGQQSAYVAEYQGDVSVEG